MARSYLFNHAIVRAPGREVVDGLRANDLGNPCFERFQIQHQAYVNALRACSVDITELPALVGYPDAMFVEDAALCLPEVAIVMRPGAPTRTAEAAIMQPSLREFYDNVLRIDAPAQIEGGDILVTEREILVGRSKRTNAAGIDALREHLRPWAYKVREVKTPAAVLHFKTDCALLDEETILATTRLSQSGCFEGYKVIPTATREEAAANSIRVNDFVLMPAGFAHTADRLSARGFQVREIENSEAAKIDGGMSCLSLRFNSGLS